MMSDEIAQAVETIRRALGALGGGDSWDDVEELHDKADAALDMLAERINELEAELGGGSPA